MYSLTVFSLVAFIASTQADLKTADNPITDNTPTPKIDATVPKSQQKDDLGIKENLEDILRDDEDDETDEIVIPSVNQLTTESNPIELGEEIKKITDPVKKRELIVELKKARDENKDTLPGKFYKAALTAIKNEEKATNDWVNELGIAAKSVMQSGTDFSSSGNVIGTARTLTKINPLGIALQRGESVLLTVLSDASKTIGKLSDSVHDTAADVFGIHKKLTARLQGVPFVGEIKSNVDDAIESNLRRGKFFVGNFAEAGAQTFAALAKDSAQKADEKEALLKQFTETGNQKLGTMG